MVRDCSKLALGCSRTAARQTSPSMSSPRGLSSTRWRMTGISSVWTSSRSFSRLIRRSCMFAPRQQDLSREHRRSNHLGGAVQGFAHPHRNDGLGLGFIQVGGGSAQRLGHRRERPGRGRHQGLDRVSRLFGSPLTKPAPGAVLPLAVLEPGVRWPAKIGCRRGEREDGVGGGIEGGTMPLVDPVVAVYARITQVLDDFLLDQVLAGEGWHNLEHLPPMGGGGGPGGTLPRGGRT